ncbi:MAG: ATP-dependent sacrificial sulfur transferase LarE [Planctomycetes bacterium]|nr:ATP-dependent sacrificial sulfur transferase LarE [Planctomycetota bacterium]
MTLTEKRNSLLERLRELPSCAVAFSGGVDSAVVAMAAHLALGEKAVAVTGVSASLAAGELEDARRLAGLIGIRHVALQTEEFASPDYVRNAPDRCYHCKTELYTQMEGVAERLDVAAMINGANADDRGDWRPGMKAASEHAVLSPLAECGFTKADVRELAAHWDLPVADKPAAPCLSSRVAYGEDVTPERLHMIDQAERFLRDLGLREVRVRYHRGDLARLEVPAGAFETLIHEQTRASLIARLREIGFKFITLDLEGFRSGSLNALHEKSLVQIQVPKPPLRGSKE